MISHRKIYTSNLIQNYSPCLQRPSVSVCLNFGLHISKTARLNLTKFFVNVAYGHHYVLLWQQCTILHLWCCGSFHVIT